MATMASAATSRWTRPAIVALILLIQGAAAGVEGRFLSTSAVTAASRFALSIRQRFDKVKTKTTTTTTVAAASSSGHYGKPTSAALATLEMPKVQNHGLPQDAACSVLLSFRRGGAAATAAVKTMTARRMEAFHLMSGGIAGTVASTITNPLEVIKTQMQSSNAASHRGLSAVGKMILDADGIAGFWRGLPATLVGIIPSRSIYFYAYHKSKGLLEHYCHLTEGSPPNALISGFLAGIAGNTVTNPIWMVRTRMQLFADSTAGQVAYAGYRDAVTQIWQSEGIRGFYKGVAASYWGCTEGAAQFFLYEQLKKRLLARRNRQLTRKGLPNVDHLDEATLFFSAALSKMVASIATYPHEVARTRLREQAKLGVFRYHGMWQTLAIIGREEGRRGLYSGMGVHLLKVVPNSALMFVTYEFVRKWLGGFQIVD